jgi:hypothetical protein
MDLVHGRFLVGVLTECEGALTNSSALHQLQSALFHALHKEGRTFSLDGHRLGITHMLGRWLERAGLLSIEQEAFVLDSSSTSRYCLPMQRNMQMVFMFLKPYLLHMGVIEEARFEQWYEQMREDLLQEDYVCQHFGLRAWGIKPGQPGERHVAVSDALPLEDQ